MFLQNPPTDLARYAAVIFGTGPAGYAVAMQLAKRRMHSLMFEAGSGKTDSQLQAELASHEGHGHFDGNHWRRHSVIGLGGTSAVWSGQCITIARRAFAEWPISWDDLAPHYPHAAKLLGRDPGVIDYRRPWLDSFEFTPYSFADNAGPLRIRAREKSLRENEFIHIVPHKILKRLQTRRFPGRVSRFTLIDARDKKENHVTTPRRMKIVLALGGIGNAQMLLQPLDDGNESVFARKGAVGRYLMEHPYTPECGVLMLDGSVGVPSPPPFFNRIYNGFSLTDRAWQRTGKIDCILNLQKRAPHPDNATKVLAKNLTNPTYHNLLLRYEMKPRESNHIRLAGQNAFGIHTAVAHCAFGADDLRGAELALQVLAKELGDKGLGFVQINNDNIYRKSYGQGHIMGTTRMGNDAKRSVVDRNARVHELQNLYIAGSSIFSNGGGAANPTLSIIALARRLAEHLADGSDGGGND